VNMLSLSKFTYVLFRHQKSVNAQGYRNCTKEGLV
jgi:hypothetical protein